MAHTVEAPVRILADMDTGIDDTLALCMLAQMHRTGRVQLLGVVGTYGNVLASVAVRNTRSVLDACGLQQVPVYAGCAGPVWAQAFAVDAGCARFHGRNGLGNVQWVADKQCVSPSVPAAKDYEKDASICCSDHAVISLGGERVSADDSRLQHRPIECVDSDNVQIIIDTVRAYGHDVTILATGPLTDIAVAIERAPDIASCMNLVLMGGSLTQEGNCYDLICETNIFQDPEAADRVFRSGAEVTMVGLDVTHQCLITRDHMKQLERSGSELGRNLARTLRFYIEANEASDPIFAQGSPLHDPLAALVAVEPDVVTCLPIGMKVETRTGVGGGFRGRTIGDPAQVRCAHPHTKVALQVDAPRAVDSIMRELLAICSQRADAICR